MFKPSFFNKSFCLRLLVVTIFFGTLSIAIYSSQGGQFGSMSPGNKALGTVALIVTETPVTVEINGVAHEIWLKNPTSGEYIQQKKTSVGTGVFVGVENDLWLVTAAHVVHDNLEAIKIFVRGEKLPHVNDKLSNLVSPTKNSRWIYHQTADVAIISLKRPPLGANIKALRLNYLEGPPEPSRDTLLTVIGFPLGLGLADSFSPLSLETKLASGLISLPRADNKKQCSFLLLQRPGVGGLSGGPVYELGYQNINNAFVSTSELKCIGIVHGTSTVENSGNFALITPSSYILEVFNGVYSKKQTKKN